EFHEQCFASNTELNICIEGKTSDTFFSEVQTFVTDQEDRSDPITAPEIADYPDQSRAGLQAERGFKDQSAGGARARINGRRRPHNSTRLGVNLSTSLWPASEAGALPEA